jgi:hypothetical protein
MVAIRQPGGYVQSDIYFGIRKPNHKKDLVWFLTIVNYKINLPVKKENPVVFIRALLNN